MKKSFFEITENDVDKINRIKHINDAIFKKGILDFEKIETIPANIKKELSEKFEISSVTPEQILTSSDKTVKFLFKLKDGNFIESVLLTDKKNRVTMCISSQSGCRMGCKFCATGKMGLIRNLNFYEIVSQVIQLFSYKYHNMNDSSRIFNIVFMGMGEPFDNFDELVKSIKTLTDSNYFHLHQSWITVSTCGIMDKVETLLEYFPKLRITVSLNYSIESKRTEAMPISKKFPITSIYQVLSNVITKYKTRITLEYVMISDKNMSDEDIEELEIFNNRSFHINVIPVNSQDPATSSPAENEIRAFTQKLLEKGFIVTRRTTKGSDINASCGQLYYKHLQRSI